MQFSNLLAVSMAENVASNWPRRAVKMVTPMRIKNIRKTRDLHKWKNGTPRPSGTKTHGHLDNQLVRRPSTHGLTVTADVYCVKTTASAYSIGPKTTSTATNVHTLCCRPSSHRSLSGSDAEENSSAISWLPQKRNATNATLKATGSP